jgi:hypothetical protein
VTKSKFLFAVLLIALATSVGWLLWDRACLRAESVRVREGLAELEGLRAENARLLQAQSDPAEAERLRQIQPELLRLRGEVTRLRQQLKETQSGLAKRTPRDPSPGATATNSPALPVETYTATLQARLTPKQTLVTGGWTTRDGKRALFLIEPDLASQPGEPGQVTLRTRIVEMPDAVLTQCGLDALRSEDKQTALQTVLTAEQNLALAKTMESAAEVEILSAPAVTTLDGRQAQVQVTEIRTAPNGETYETGPLIDITPSLSADGGTIDLRIAAQLRLPTAPAP